MAPAISIAEAYSAAIANRIAFALISGLPAVEAKNAAVLFADRSHCGLLLVEDDVRLEAAQVADLLDADTVAILSATCRNGEHNTKYDPDGNVLYSGTVAVFLPRAVLEMLPRPVFEAMQYTPIDGELAPVAPSSSGNGSDTHLFYLLRKLGVPIKVVGHATTLVHPMNRGAYDLQGPCEIEELG